MASILIREGGRSGPVAGGVGAWQGVCTGACAGGHLVALDHRRGAFQRWITTEGRGRPPSGARVTGPGSVITGMRGAGHLVYLAAFVPETGESAAALGGASARLRQAIRAEDRAIDPDLQRRLAARCTHVREWRTGHSPFLGRPDLVVGLVRELLAGLPTPSSGTSAR
ncbi:alpha/beta fold hydrolase [Streptomyces sp. NPDC003688]